MPQWNSLSNQINKESWFAFKRLSTRKETLHVECYKQYVLVVFREANHGQSSEAAFAAELEP